MLFITKDRKQDLVQLTTELGEKVESDLRVVELRHLIMKIQIFTADVEFVKNTLNKIIAERLENETEKKVRLTRENPEVQNRVKAEEKANEQKGFH
ncbi:hypothetical protein CDAR_126021 [Caerostris darwini]|uniref:Uncharacterized protein n=1 Tax=Caerostris darwini TaxID=1538125 RepID=A0AAV4SAI5_9ARAC|nr:hypothetical protein CDAR_126021 [Caerostris darwini]